MEMWSSEFESRRISRRIVNLPLAWYQITTVITVTNIHASSISRFSSDQHRLISRTRRYKCAIPEQLPIAWTMLKRAISSRHLRASG